MKTKTIALFTIVFLLYGGLIFGVTRHTPEDKYVFRHDTIIETTDVNNLILFHDPNGLLYPDNDITVYVVLPSNLSMTTLQFVDFNDPILDQFRDKELITDKSLCKIAYLYGSLTKGNYEIVFTATDSAGNEENAWYIFNVIPADTIPPTIRCGG